MSTYFFLRTVAADAPDDVGSHDQTSPYLLDELHFGSDYNPDFAAYARYAIQKQLLPDWEKASPSYRPVTITEEAIAAVEQQMLKFTNDEKWWQDTRWRPDTLPNEAQAFSELYMNQVLDWLRERVGQRVVGFVW
jgi:hypothetical protein